MNYIKIALRLKKIVGIEFFVFLGFLLICEIINEVLFIIPPSSNEVMNIFISIVQLLISGLFALVWLGLWYWLTKKVMFSSNTKDEENIK